ncbi:acyl-CoA dehydrogenase, short-chain specific [[Clostridium] ultunense Esp]|uniref:acyl-CoA dehydrogenase family protein n=1 Tax=Thermicanus aegyptius TaxID=94009 RepID=UPI0002B70596|nr:acyl-CoA dehydrogenase family protein [Thermicanus aegyptius]CCQ96088.1 acyl-CoA dehydrogenase, short-chain specific [[Clostridium] ultunense Esp]
MNFELTVEQKMIKDLVRQFTEEEVAPGAVERDRTGRFPLELIHKMARLGLMGLPFPEEYGGAGADTISFAIATEELSRGCGSLGITYSAHISLGAAPIYLFGTREQKLRYLPQLTRGETLGAFALTEPHAGSDAGGTETMAEKIGNQYRIRGTKVFITNAGYAKFIALTAVTGKSEKGKRISSMIVPTDSPGLTIRSSYEKMGLHASNTTEIILEDVPVPTENLLGVEGEGLKQFLITLDGGRIGIAAMAVGLAQSAFEKALRYAKTRVQFGTAISKFEAIQFKLAEMAMKIELARNMVYKAAWLKDQGKPFTKEASMAKLYASEMAVDVSDEAIQIHGGYGYMREFEVERIYRDAKLLEIGEGTSEIQHLVIARQLGL